ncbi:hypothetical protein [Streptomyces sp. NPDC002550]
MAAGHSADPARRQEAFELDARRHAATEASVAFIAAAATLLNPDNR